MPMKTIALVLLIVSAGVGGYTLQEESGACLPESHTAEQQGKAYCHCVAMGGYQLCHGSKPFSYQEWVEENQKREADTDKKGKQKQPDIPQCAMSCKEDHCECCAYMEKFKDKRRAAITIPYDTY